MIKNKNAFTLIEILVWIVIFSIVIIGWFQALSSVTLWKIKLMEKTDITKESFYFSEKFFEEIKKGGTIDFEEYFNRKVLWNTTFWSWHYAIPSWFGNFWSDGVAGSNTYWTWFYYCASPNLTQMWTGWCYISWKNQRYWQYAFQFIDYNSNFDIDIWDENWDGNIRWDDDDEPIWEWPDVFTWWTNVKEIYLISWDRKKRTLFRWNWKLDPYTSKITPTPTCNSSTFWSWCLWTIEFLKLEWKDWWINHLKSWIWLYDWIIDTWIIDKDFTGWVEIIAGSNLDTWFWQPIFSNNTNVSDFKVYMYPNKDKKYAWKNYSYIDFNPYLKIQITLSPSLAKKWGIKWKIPEIKLATTINLTDYFSK